MIKLSISFKDIAHQVHLRSYYFGEALKRKDPDNVSIQSGEDDMDLLRPMTETAVEEIVSFMLKRARRVDWEETENDEIEVEIEAYRRVPQSDEARVGKLLGKSVMDYLVLRTLQQWYGAVKPELRESVEYEISLSQTAIQKDISMISGRIRRRCTDLGGI